MNHRVLILVLGLPLLACSYTFSNPAEQLDAGQVSGRVLADRQGTGTLAAFGGVAVSLKGSAFSQVTHDTGRFTLLPLPPGRHTLLFRRNTLWALERDVEIAFGKDGQPEGVSLGDVVLRYASAVSGTVLPPAGTTSADGVAVDESTGQTAAVVGGSFRFPVLPLGQRRLTVALRDPLTLDQWVGGPVLVSLGDADQQTERTLAPVPLHQAAGTGRLRFRISSVGLSLDPATVTITGLPPAAAALSARGQAATPDSNGDVDVTLPEGVYFIGLVPPAGSTGALPPSTATAVVLANRVAELGTLYVVQDAAVQAAQASCEGSADCGGSICSAGACTDWIPPASAPADAPYCDLARMAACPSPGFACSLPGGFAGSCLFGPAQGMCVPCGTCCTLDGTSTLCAPAGAGGC